jgi:hypothetical protein
MFTVLEVSIVQLSTVQQSRIAQYSVAVEAIKKMRRKCMMTCVSRKMRDITVDTAEKCTWWRDIQCINV